MSSPTTAWRRRTARSALLVASTLLLSGSAPADGPATSNGISANDSYDGVISASGRFVAFTSVAEDLVPDDDNGVADIFRHDTKTGMTTRVSVDAAGAQAAGDSDQTSMSANGRFVAFVSEATNLVPGDRNGRPDVFVKDTKTGAIGIVSVSSEGTQADDDCSDPAISANGRFVAFHTAATTLVAGDTNGHFDVFVHDRKLGTTVRVSVDSDGNQTTSGNSSAPSFSASGRFVAFQSDASDLVADDSNEKLDVFVHDLKTGATTRASVDSAGEDADEASQNPVLSANGRYVSFDSQADDLVPGDSNSKSDVFRRDRKVGTTVCLSVSAAGVFGDDDSQFPRASARTGLVGFSSHATNLVADDTNGANDAFVANLKKGTIIRASLGAGGEAEENVGCSGLSASARFVLLNSLDSTLVPDDTNNATDVFVRDLKKGTTTRVSVDSEGGQTGP